MNYEQVQQANSLIAQLQTVNSALALCAQVNPTATPPVLAQISVAIQVGEASGVCVPISIENNIPLLTSAMQTLAQVFEDQAQSIQAQLSALGATAS